MFTMHNTPYVEFFDGGDAPQLERLGGKCASLVSMTEAGMPVPPGYAITTDSFNAFIDEAGIRQEIAEMLKGIDPQDSQACEDVSAKIREAIESRPVPPQVRADVVAAYEALQSRFGETSPVAVRSSATAEDLPDASFAGQQDTYLWLTDLQSVLDHIRKCWASLYTSRAILYRLRNGISEDDLSMAVAVQKMVSARTAGVAMTLDPSTGNPSVIVIDASWGVGEMVVSGEVTPDHYRIDKVTLQDPDITIGDKHAELVPDPSTGTLVHRDVEPERRDAPCLSIAQIQQVATMAKRAERHYGCPQDIEWAFDADLPEGEDLLLLQSRPETVHSSGTKKAESQKAAETSAAASAAAATALGAEQEGEVRSFPSPFSVADPEGAEGWEKLYPYYLTFQPSRREKDGAEFWFQNSQQWPAVLKPFETIGCEFAIRQLGEYNARHLLIPNANGIDYRIHQGYLYMSPISVPESEQAARAAEFEQRAGHYFQNWEQLLENWYQKVPDVIRRMDAIEFASPPEAVPMEDIRSGLGKDGSEKLFKAYDELIGLAYENWQYHFEFLNLGYIAYLDFFGFCKEAFPSISDRTIATMVQGEDMELFRPDDELKKLALSAIELKLQECFSDTSDADAVLARIGAAPSGQEWLAQLEEAKDPWFNFTTGNGFYGHDRYWLDHMEIPLEFIKDYIRRAEDGAALIRPIEELKAERERILQEYRDLLPEDQRSTYDEKAALAKVAYPYVENHNFYIEHWTMGTFWRKVRELSRVFMDHGFWPEESDVLYLGREEVRQALFDLVNGFGIGGQAVGPDYWAEELPRRRKIIEALESQRPEPAFNTPPEFVTEPFTVMLYGITTDQVAQWLGVSDEVEGEIRGMAASPGVVEGIARVITTADRLSELQDGEILVAPNTSPSWGPVFGKILATVTDIGGMMSHAAIVCREYALPAVTGAGSAAREIRTGQRIRVDGDRGIVTILDDQPVAVTAPAAIAEEMA
ncbi:PEP/pyruvate-binding domain-containing protein [Kocuria palustris]|uniref:PEP/pyruvate-binding domain-containing protein n=1 Tax=Kocuria palustris TaxID=71999 RepID=UPI000AC9F2D0|nr:PEP/pyruvate-binding domain-containing protein [Kocuria palustris]